MMKVLSHPSHGKYWCCIVGNWTSPLIQEVSWILNFVWECPYRVIKDFLL